MNRHSAARPAFAGFTLVETMVAIVIGMLATLIVMQVYATSEGQKRTTTFGADAQSDAAAILYLMESDLRQAGYGLAANPEDFTPAFSVPTSIAGLTSGVLAQCATVQAYNTTRGAAFTYTDYTFAPVVINPSTIPAGDDGTDVVLVNYGASSGVIGKGFPLSGQQNTGGNLLSFVVGGAGSPDPRAGFVQGDMYLAVPAAGSGLNCTIGEVTGVPPGVDPPNCSVGGGVQNIIERNAGADHQYSSFYKGCGAGPAVTATWNQVGGDDVDYTGGRLYNLGPVGAFVSRVYAVRKGNLTVCDLTANDCTADPPDLAMWTPIGSDVVGLHAQYGKDTDFNGSVDAWDATTLTGAARAEVVAVRLGLAVRSGQYEKDPATTAGNPVWHKDANGTGNIDFDIGGITDAGHYRYKTAQSIVPVRNLIWGQQKPL